MTNKDNKQQAMTKKCNKQLQKINNNKLKTTNNNGKKNNREYCQSEGDLMNF